MAAAAISVAASSFGDPSCWVGGLRYMPCCSIKVFGPEGNPECWEDVPGGRSFARCCIAEHLGHGVEEFQQRRQAGSILERAQGSFHATVTELAQLVHRLDLERHTLGGARFLRPLEAELLTELGDLLRQWRASHLLELSNRLPEVLATFDSQRASVERSSDLGGRKPPRVAILTACTPDSASSSICQLGSNLWQCYARRHGYHFIFDSNPYPAFPRKFRFGGTFNHSPPAALDADFDDEDTSFIGEEPVVLETNSDGLTFKWWQRWYAARRHLPFYDLLLVVDPDTAVFPTCHGADLLSVLGLSEDTSQWPGVIVRDPRDGEDLNGGVVALTRSPWGMLYLELLLARSRWPIDNAGGSGWCHARQAAEYETLLEVIALQRAETLGESLDYTSECHTHAVPQAVQRQGDTIAGCIWPLYTQCWRKVTRRLLGPPGQRVAVHVQLVDPTRADINYRPWSNEPRYRAPFLHSEDVPPLANSAFLWHYVAIPNKTDKMLRDFRLAGLPDTFDCQQLWRRFDEDEMNGHFPACTLAGSLAACPFEDTELMPHAFGC